MSGDDDDHRHPCSEFVAVGLRTSSVRGTARIPSRVKEGIPNEVLQTATGEV